MIESPVWGNQYARHFFWVGLNFFGHHKTAKAFFRGLFKDTFGGINFQTMQLQADTDFVKMSNMLPLLAEAINISS